MIEELTVKIEKCTLCKRIVTIDGKAAEYLNPDKEYHNCPMCNAELCPRCRTHPVNLDNFTGADISVCDVCINKLHQIVTGACGSWTR